MSDTPVLLKENLLRDVEELCQEIDEPFTDEDVISQTYGLDLMAAAVYFTETYKKPGDFMTSLKSKILLYNRLTPAQARAALNILRQEVRGESKAPAARPVAVQCFTCKREFADMQALYDHKEADHAKGRQSKVNIAPDGEEFQPEKVIKSTASTLQLDLSNVPDGRYAAPDLTGKNDYVFLMVKRIRKRIFRDRAYTYGKIISGKEFVEAGTIEVKEWSSDSKRLCGEQKPGLTYVGEFEIQLNAIKAAPEVWSRLFGQNIGRCGICSKTLTDEISRNDGFGPDCIEKVNSAYFSRAQVEQFKRQYDSNVGRERVYCLEHKRYECEEKHSFYDLDDEVE